MTEETAWTVEAINQRLAALRTLERQEDANLFNIETRSFKIESLLSTLEHSRAKLAQLGKSAAEMSSNLESACENALQVSQKVRTLDLVKSRVAEALSSVNNIVDLQDCHEGVQRALEHGEYEKAAHYVHRFNQLDPTLRQQKDPEKIAHAVSTLAEVLGRRADAAVEDRDTDTVIKWAVLFPLFGEHKRGLEFIVNLLNHQIVTNAHPAERVDSQAKYAPSQEGDAMDGQSPVNDNDNHNGSSNNPVDGDNDDAKYTNAIKRFLNKAVMALSAVFPRVQTHFGPGAVFHLLSVIQSSVDACALAIVDEFLLFRGIEEKVQAEQTDSRVLDGTVNELAMMLQPISLYARFLESRLTADITAYERAKATALPAPPPQELTTTTTTATTSAPAATAAEEREGNQGAQQLSAAEKRAWETRRSPHVSREGSRHEMRAPQQQEQADVAERRRMPPAVFPLAVVPQASTVRRDSKLFRKMEEMHGLYVLLEAKNLEAAIDMAIEEDEVDFVQSAKITKCVEDVLYLCQKATRRAFMTVSELNASSVVNNVGNALISQLLTYVDAKMKVTAKKKYDFRSLNERFLSNTEKLRNRLSTNLGGSTSKSSNQGAQALTQSTHDNNDDSKQRGVQNLDYMVWVNNAQYILELAPRYFDDTMKNFQHLCRRMSDADNNRLRIVIENNQRDLMQETRRYVQNGAAHIVAMAVNSKLKGALAALPFASYELSEADFDALDSAAPQMHDFALLLHRTILQLKEELLPSLFEVVALKFCEVICENLHYEIGNGHFNQLGGLQLDRDVGYLVSALSRSVGWPINDIFAATVEMGLLLALDEVDSVYNYYKPDSGRHTSGLRVAIGSSKETPATTAATAGVTASRRGERGQTQGAVSSNAVSWHLTAQETREVLMRRVDFDDAKIKALVL